MSRNIKRAKSEIHEKDLDINEIFNEFAGKDYLTFEEYDELFCSLISDPRTIFDRIKRPFEDGWRFIGGFSKPTDTSYEHTARRKVSEDAGRNLSINTPPPTPNRPTMTEITTTTTR